MNATPGFFALSRCLAKLGTPEKAQAPGTIAFPSSDPRELNGVEAHCLGAFVFLYWITALNAVTPDWLPFYLSLPLAAVAVFILLQLITAAVAWLFEFFLVRRETLSRREARLRHTSLHVYATVAFAAWVVFTDVETGFWLTLFSINWLCAGVANTVVAIFERSNAR